MCWLGEKWKYPPSSCEYGHQVKSKERKRMRGKLAVIGRYLAESCPLKALLSGGLSTLMEGWSINGRSWPVLRAKVQWDNFMSLGSLVQVLSETVWLRQKNWFPRMITVCLFFPICGEGYSFSVLLYYLPKVSHNCDGQICVVHKKKKMVTEEVLLKSN